MRHNGTKLPTMICSSRPCSRWLVALHHHLTTMFTRSLVFSWPSSPAIRPIPGARSAAAASINHRRPRRPPRPLPSFLPPRLRVPRPRRGSRGRANHHRFRQADTRVAVKYEAVADVAGSGKLCRVVLFVEIQYEPYFTKQSPAKVLCGSESKSRNMLHFFDDSAIFSNGYL